MIGETLDDTYRVVERLGAGAMGEVYLVEHIHIGRREAIKVLRPEMANDTRLSQRFRREARAINRLRHPNIIGIYDFGQLPDGRLYLTMEYVDGEVVDSLLRREGRVEVGRALHIIHQLALAMDHAHSHDVVHRDLKPHNLVLVEERGRLDVVKVLDFGLAKVVDPGSSGDELTLRGELFGTPEYMAPERMAGGPDDPRSDLYAIGCIATELLTGKPPFSGSRNLVMASHMQTVPPPVSRAVPTVPGVLDVIIQQLLAKDVTARIQTAKQLAAAIEQVPGFPRKKFPRSGAVSPLGHSSGNWVGGGDASSAALKLTEFHDEMTIPEQRQRQASARAFADTAASLTEEVRDEIFNALLECAQQTVEQHGGDEALSIALALVHGVRDDRLRILGERQQLEERQTLTLQSAREREGSLRFAIAELRFERQKAGPELIGDLDYQILALDNRVKELSKELTRQLDELDNRGIELAAQGHDLEDHWLEVHRRLRAALEGRLAALGAAAGPLAARFLAVGTATLEMLPPE